MGQQQLLLIVLGVILVGVAVVLGIQYFGVGAEEGAKDELTAHNLIIGANAQEWFKKPASMGGGDLSFSTFVTNQWTPNLEPKLGQSTNGTYGVAVVDSAHITITGTPRLDTYAWTVISTVTQDSVTTVITPR
jgi:hypothetical protein